MPVFSELRLVIFSKQTPFGGWNIGGQCPRLKECSQNFLVALEASLIGQPFIFQTIIQPWALSSDIPASRKGVLFIL